MKQNSEDLIAVLHLFHKYMEKKMQSGESVQTCFGKTIVSGYVIRAISTYSGFVRIEAGITTRSEKENDDVREGDTALFIIKNNVVYTQEEWESMIDAENREIERKDKEFEQHGGQYDEEYDYIMYHAATKSAAKKICSDGIFVSYDADMHVSTKPDGRISGYGDTIVELHVSPLTKMVLNDIFEDEALYTIPLKRIGSSHMSDISKYSPRIWHPNNEI